MQYYNEKLWTWAQNHAGSGNIGIQDVAAFVDIKNLQVVYNPMNALNSEFFS